MENEIGNDNIQGNPDVDFGADESGSNDVEIDTAGLDSDKEIDLDRSGLDSIQEDDDSSEANFSGHEDLDNESDDDPASFSSSQGDGQADASI